MKYHTLTSFTKAILVFIFIILCTTTKAQDNYQYQPMAIEGATWVFEKYHYVLVGRFGYHITGDTIIDGLEYKKGYNLGINTSIEDSTIIVDYNINIEYPSFFMRDDTINKKVHAIWSGSDESFNCQPILDPKDEFLLYDFGVEANDTAFVCDDYNVLAGNIDTVELFGYIVPLHKIGEHKQYEKIGDEDGLFSNTEFIFVGDYWIHLLQYCVGNLEECAYNVGPLSNDEILNNNNINLYPNPAYSSIDISSSITLKSLTIYNLSGQQVQNHLDINKKEIEINTSDLLSQTYIVLLRLKDGSLSRKTFIKL